MFEVAFFALAGALGGWASWLAAERLAAGKRTGAEMRRWLRPLAITAGAGLLASAAWRSGGDVADVAATALLAAPLLITLLTDLLARLVYPTVLLPGIAAALMLATMRPPGLLEAVIGGAAATVVVALLVLLARWLWPDGEVPLGSGDILIAALIGTIFGPVRAPGVFVVGVLAGAVAASVLLLTGRARREDAMPYGAVFCGVALMALVM